MTWKDDNFCLMHGRFVSDPELVHTSQNVACCNFTIANNRGRNKNTEQDLPANYIDCVAFGKPAEIIADVFKKGQKIHITGSLVQNRWIDKSGNKRSNIKLHVYSFAPIESRKREKNGNRHL